MSDLEKEVEQLKEQVKKLQTLLASTGQQVLQLQMHKHKQEINDIGHRTQDLQAMVPASVPPSAAGRKSDYVTESDLGDMVVELQGQLTLLDQRNIKRILNSRSTNKLVPLPNADGETHPSFPATVEALQALGDYELFDQWNHYEMLPNGETLDDLLGKEKTEAAAVSNKRMMDEIYTSFAEYLGVDPVQFPRKTKATKEVPEK